MSELRAAVIGLGVGERHIAGYSNAEGCEVVAACDIDAVRLAEIGEQNPGLRLTEDADSILGDPEIDVVSIASYDDFHFEQVKRALEAGKHVFVEKPLCQTQEEMDELHSILASRPELRLSSNLPLRASPRFAELRAQIAGGELGRLYYLEGDYEYGRLWKITEGWRGSLDHYSVFTGGAVHIVDLLLWLTGDRVVRASAAGNRIATEDTAFRFDDLVVALLEFESGLVAKVSANFACVHPHFHALRVFGTDGTFVNGLGDGELWRRGGEGPQRTSVTAAYPGVEKADLIPGFIESIRGSGPAPVGADEVFATMAVCFAVERALESGQPSEVRAPG
jgi:predicted dehydrogenase